MFAVCTNEKNEKNLLPLWFVRTLYEKKSRYYQNHIFSIRQYLLPDFTMSSFCPFPLR